MIHFRRMLRTLLWWTKLVNRSSNDDVLSNKIGLTLSDLAQ